MILFDQLNDKLMMMNKDKFMGIGVMRSKWEAHIFSHVFDHLEWFFVVLLLSHIFRVEQNTQNFFNAETPTLFGTFLNE